MVDDPVIPGGGPPLDQGQPLPPERHADLAPTPDPFATPSAAPDVTQTVDAAFRLGNPIASFLASNPLPDQTPTPGYNPLDTIRGTPHEGGDLTPYLGSPNEAYTRGIMAQQDSEDKDRATLAASGWAGTVATVGAGLTDPLLYVPIVGDFAAAGIAGKAAILAVQGAAGSAASEAALHATQVGRSWQDSAYNVASGTILGGVMGGAWGMLAPAEQAAASKALEEVRPRMTPDGAVIPAPVGAAVTDTRQLELKGSLGFAKVGVSPNLRIYNSPFVEARRMANDMANTGLQFKPDEQIAPAGPVLENQVNAIKNEMQANVIKTVDDAWTKHYYGETPPSNIKAALGKEGFFAPTVGDKLGNHDFDQAVGVAMNNGDVHQIPEVQQAAQKLRSETADPLAKMAEETKFTDGTPMLDPNRSGPKGAVSFFPRMYDRDTLKAKYAEAQQFFTDHLEREQNVKAALQDRIRAGDQSAVAEWEGNRALKPDEDPAIAAQRMLAKDTSLSRQELHSRSQEWLDRTIGSPNGRLDYDVQPASAGFHPSLNEVRGSLKDRAVALDGNELIKRGYVNTSAKQGMASLLRNVVPDALIIRRHGDLSMENGFRKIQDEAAARISAGGDSTKLIAQRDGDIADLMAMRDRLRNVHGWDASPDSRHAAAVIRDFQNLNVITKLGSSSIVRLTDLTNGVFRYGIARMFKDAWVPLVKNLMSGDFRGFLADQARDAGLGLNGMIGHSRHNLYDVIDSAPQNKFSRGLAAVADKSMWANLHTWLTDISQRLSWNVAQGELGRVAGRVADGTVTAADMERLAQASISPEMAARISRQYEQHHIEVSGSKFADTSKWTDRGARDSFNAAMQHESSMSVMQAGIGDKPVFMDKKMLSLLTQFKGFVFAAHEKVLIANIQQHDARTLQGFMVTLGMGALATALYKEAAGQPWPTTPENFLAESIDRSAMTGLIGEFNRTLSGATHGQASLDRLYGATGPLSRRANIDLLGQFAGPTGDVLQKTGKTLYDASTGNFGATDLHNIRQTFMPLQNLMGARIGFDKAGDAFENALGIPAKGQ